MRSPWLLALLLPCAVVASDGKQHASGATHTVTIENLQFNPPDLEVQRGDRVVWVNKDLFPHTVTAVSKAFDSGSIAAGASWTYVPHKRGEYAYGCNFHPNMKGTLRVR